jgi:hypothetical protein
MATEAEDAGIVGAELEERRFTRSEIRVREGDGIPPLSEAVAAEVGNLLRASEAAGRAIRERALADAQAVRDALQVEAETTRREIVVHAQRELAATVGESLRRITEKAAKLDADLDDLRVEATQLAVDMGTLGVGTAPPELPAGERRSDDDERRGRLIALTMAINGAPREETALYLEENLDLDDVESLLDSVYR